MQQGNQEYLASSPKASLRQGTSSEQKLESTVERYHDNVLMLCVSYDTIEPLERCVGERLRYGFSFTL